MALPVRQPECGEHLACVVPDLRFVGLPLMLEAVLPGLRGGLHDRGAVAAEGGGIADRQLADRSAKAARSPSTQRSSRDGWGAVLALWRRTTGRTDSGMMHHAALGLRALAESLPAGTAIPVPRELLLELLEGHAPAGQPAAADPTVDEVATRYGRAPSTVRGWCEAGRFPGAYKLHDREWRIPRAAVEAFDVAQRERPAGPARRGVPSLSDWRHAS